MNIVTTKRGLQIKEIVQEKDNLEITDDSLQEKVEVVKRFM